MEQYTHIYFIGIGGIGMSSLARYFKHEGKQVAGYDRTETPLTRELVKERIVVKYDDSVSTIPKQFLRKESTLIIYTPAIPASHSELNYFIKNGFNLIKRAKVLGLLSANKYLMAVAGTHGKTTTTTMLAWFNNLAATFAKGSEFEGQTGGGSAFLGGISKNMDTNMVLGRGERLSVEADEFDRSFLQLYPDVALVTSVDADHLDIYKDHQTLKNTFTEFVSQIKNGGTLVYHYGIDLKVTNKNINVYTYSLDNIESDFYAENITKDDSGCYTFDIVSPLGKVCGCRLGIPGLINVENCIGAFSLLWCAGFDEKRFKEATDSFRGVKRRFDFYVNSPEIIYMDDYAHHPSELRATLNSVRAMFPEREITAVFQPHLYTRTRDFADEFAEILSVPDKIILLPIYPAREEPIEGVTSEMILSKIVSEDKHLIEKAELVKYLRSIDKDILITFGAGDIDSLCSPVYEMLKQEYDL